MAPRCVEGDWSDSDDEHPSGMETSVLLGIPDGPITNPRDIRDAAVSRIGGHPAFLPSNVPSVSSSQCKICSYSMELLVQLWCPFEDSSMDRALYVWGCSRRACQRKEGSVRAWRGLRLNTEYATQLAEQMSRQSDKKGGGKAAEQTGLLGFNPFALAPPNSSGVGSDIFGDNANTFESASLTRGGDDAERESTGSPSDDSVLTTAMAGVAIEESDWVLSPFYSATYLSTMTECLPPARSKSSHNVRIEDVVDVDAGKDTSWNLENYENSLHVDRIFEIFSRQVGYQGGQCVRYELGGKPLPFGSDRVFDQLFPLPPPPTLPLTKATFTVAPRPVRCYQPKSIPRCPFCGSERVFECQLMPNLLNVLAQDKDGDTGKQMAEQERVREVAKLLRGGHDMNDKVGMEWGTCMIFSCGKDCSEETECWREEVVFVQWEE